MNTLYLRFKARYSFINAKQNLKHLDRRSPLLPFLKALEEPARKGAWKKAALFHSRTIRPLKRTASVSTPVEALLLCLNECGKVDLARIAETTGFSESATTAALRGLLYELPSGEYQTAEEYLSGDVVRKLREAQNAAALDPRYQVKVEALTKGQPNPLGAEEIAARLGAGWIPTDVVKSFLCELVPQFNGQVRYIESLSA